MKYNKCTTAVEKKKHVKKTAHLNTNIFVSTIFVFFQSYTVSIQGDKKIDRSLIQNCRFGSLVDMFSK